jgi:hypothetical protein
MNAAYSNAIATIQKKANRAMRNAKGKGSGPRSRPHLVKQGTAIQLVVKGKPLIMLAGEAENRSGYGLEFMEKVWDRLAAMNLNTLLIPLYWHSIEPHEGKYDFTLIKGHILAARKRSMHIVFLWFGSWKNGCSYYVPDWIKNNKERFPYARDSAGKEINMMSAFNEEGNTVDARVFAAIMRYIRSIDQDLQTVIMMQPENEIGILGASRDYSPLGQAAFQKQVPAELIDYLGRHKDSLVPEVRGYWGRGGFRTSGTWSEVFGKGADEIFMTWHIARYVENVARAGRAEYDLPMFVNAWLIREDLGGNMGEPGGYPCGGPNSKVLDIWKAAAPHIDILSPDCYKDDFRGTCGQFHRRDNPLLVPETYPYQPSATAVFYVIGQHDGMMISPYAIDRFRGLQPANKSYDMLEGLHPVTESYGLIKEMMPLITKLMGKDKMRGMFQQKDSEEYAVEFGKYTITVVGNQPFTSEEGRKQKEVLSLFPSDRIPGGGLLMDLGGNEYIFAGRGITLKFKHRSGSALTLEWIDDGWFTDGKWRPWYRLSNALPESDIVEIRSSNDRLVVRKFKISESS